jgi:RHS repeat-associated protein
MSPGHPKMRRILPLAHPFGMNQEGAWGVPTNTTENRYQYNGKELNTDFGLNLNDYGARWYDSVLGRWTSVDPLAEKYHAWSAYSYVMGRPLAFIDPDGRSGEPVFDKDTKTLTIHSNLILYGDAASAELATQAAKDIQDAWNAAGTEIGGYKIKFSVTGSYRSDLTKEEVEGNTDIRNNYIKVVEDHPVGVSFMDADGSTGGSNTGVWLLKNIKKEGSTTEAHEFGHGYGIDAHSEKDQRGQGPADIMGARGTLVDSQYQYDPKAAAGAKGGTVNPDTRKVKDQNVRDVFNNIRFNINGTSTWRAGKLTNKFH